MKRPWLSLAVILVLAFALRAMFYVVGDPVFGDADSGGYLLHSRDALQSGIVGLFTFANFAHPTTPPLYPYLTAWATVVFGDLELAGRFVSTVAGVTLVAIVYAIALKVYDRQVAFIAATFVAVHRLLVEVSYEPLTEALYVTVLYAGVYAVLRSLERFERRWVLLTSLLFVTAYLARPEGFIHAVLVPLVFVGASFLYRRPWRESAVPATLYLVVFAVAVLPYLVSLRNQLGHWTINRRTGWASVLIEAHDRGSMGYEEAIYGLDRPAANSAEVDRTIEIGDPMESRSLLSTVLRYPAVVAGKAFHNIDDALRDVAPIMLSPFLAALVGLGLIAAPWTVERLRREAVLFVLLGPAFLIPVLWGTDLRHYAAAVPLLLLWSANGARTLGEHARKLGEHVSAARPRIGTLVRPTLLGVAVGAVVAGEVVSVGVLAEEQSGQDYATTTAIERDFGQWMKDHLPEERPLVATRKPFIALFSDARRLALPYGSLEDVLEYLQEQKADYLYINETRIDLRPELAVLFDPSYRNPTLELVHADLRFPGARLFLFRINSKGDA